MIKFFRNIRKSLLDEGKTSKYLKYAIGEIVLVVIGILIALQINNWNSLQKDRQIERQYLEGFLTDLRSDSSTFEYFKNSVPKKIEALLLARANIYQPKHIKDTLKFIDTLGYGGVASRTALFENQSTYKDIISTGNLRLIQNKALRQILLEYYQYSDNTEIYLGNLRTEYTTYMNSLYPYDRRDSFKPYPEEVNQILDALKTNEFLKLANSELAYAYALKVRFNSLTRFNQELLKFIETELNKHYD